MDDFYENEVEPNITESEDKDKVNEMKSEVTAKALQLCDKFCSFQKKYFKLYLEEPQHSSTKVPEVYQELNPERNINGHVQGLLQFLKNRKDMYTSIDKERFSEKMENAYPTLVNKLLGIQEEVISKHYDKINKKSKNLTISRRKRSTNDPLNYTRFLSDVDEAISYRRAEHVKDSPALNTIKNELVVMFEGTLKLISRYLGLVFKSQQCYTEEHLGVVRYIVGRVGSKIHVHLKNVDLKARNDMETCNFKIKINLVPLKDDDSKSFTGESTLVYHETKHVLFGMKKDNEDDTNCRHKFVFDVGGKDTRQENNNIKQYIEFNLYDICTVKDLTRYTIKYFRGQILLPIDEKIPFFLDMKEFEDYAESTNQLVEGEFVCANSEDLINDTQDKNTSSLMGIIYNELKTNRKEKIASHYKKIL